MSNKKPLVTKEIIERVSRLMLDKEQAEGLIDYITSEEPLAYKAMLDLVDTFVSNTTHFIPTKDVELLYAFIGAAFFTGYLLSRESLLPMNELENLLKNSKTQFNTQEYDSYIDQLLDSGMSYSEIGNQIKKAFKDIDKKYTTRKKSRKIRAKSDSSITKEEAKEAAKKVSEKKKSSKKLPKNGLDFSL